MADSQLSELDSMMSYSITTGGRALIGKQTASESRGPEKPVL